MKSAQRRATQPALWGRCGVGWGGVRPTGSRRPALSPPAARNWHEHRLFAVTIVRAGVGLVGAHLNSLKSDWKKPLPRRCVLGRVDPSDESSPISARRPATRGGGGRGGGWKFSGLESRSDSPGLSERGSGAGPADFSPVSLIGIMWLPRASRRLQGVPTTHRALLLTLLCFLAAAAPPGTPTTSTAPSTTHSQPVAAAAQTASTVLPANLSRRALPGAARQQHGRLQLAAGSTMRITVSKPHAHARQLPTVTTTH